MAFNLGRTICSICSHKAMLCLTLLLLSGANLQARPSSPLVTFESAAQSGLQRAWFAQIRVDQTRYRIHRWLLAGDRLLAVTTGGTVHVLDATTGDTLWTTRIGRIGHPALGPAINSEYVAIISGTKIHVLDRTDGHSVWSKNLGGVPAGGPALSEGYVYATLVNGRVEAHQLDNPKAPTWFYQSVGKVFQHPTSTGAVVTWPNDRGHLYVAAAADPKVLFRLETTSEVVAPAVEKGLFLYVASSDGYLYCVDRRTREQQWRASIGSQVKTMPAVVGDRVFVASEAPTLDAINVATGRMLWMTEGVAQFAAMSEHHVFGMDGQGTLLGLDRETGRITSRLKARIGTTAIVNDQTDRVFLVDDRGLVQCFHEIGADEPIQYRQKPGMEKPQMADEPESPLEEPADEGELLETDEDDSSDDFDDFLL